MKFNKIKINHLAAALFISTLLCMSACKINELPDPNNPSLGVISADASLSEIQNLVDGINAGMRLRLGTYLDAVGVVGREYYRVSNSDPRFTSDLLGKNEAILDANTFYTTNPFSSRYRVIKNANILIEAITNSSAPIPEEQRATTIGFAKTVKAYQLLLVLNQQYTNGVRVDVADPDNPGPFLDLNGSLDAIASLLDEGNTDLARGTGFPFSLISENWIISEDIRSGDVTTIDASHVALFNRAIAARVDLYRSDWQGAIDALNASFFALDGAFDLGVYHPYSTGGGDELNPMWFPPNASGEFRVAHPSYNTDIRMDDGRIAKVSHRVAPNDMGGIDTLTAFSDDLSSDYDVNIYPSNTTSIGLIRNEELILIYAEASAQLDATANAVAGIERIMGAVGLGGSYSGGTTKDELIDEILYHRRYSLFGEGHRWVDLRRYDRLNTLPIDRAGDDVWSEFPRPANEDG